MFCMDGRNSSKMNGNFSQVAAGGEWTGVWSGRKGGGYQDYKLINWFPIPPELSSTLLLFPERGRSQVGGQERLTIRIEILIGRNVDETGNNVVSNSVTSCIRTYIYIYIHTCIHLFFCYCSYFPGREGVGWGANWDNDTVSNS